MREYYRPLKIMHYWNQLGAENFEEKVAYVEDKLLEIKAEGYGGVVTNVMFGKNYGDDPEEYELIKQVARLCEKHSMRMWIYDEDGYPSGTAGTKTLSANLDFEARAVVMVAKVLEVGEEWNSVLPKGHEKPLSAFGYTMSGEAVTEEELAQWVLHPGYDNGFYFLNDTDRKMLCLAFYQKRSYEGTHCHHNTTASRRYIDVSNPEAVAEFINNTYRPYAETLKGMISKEFGKDGVVDATFTDEPSYMGHYLSLGLYPKQVDHPYDDTIPLYPVTNWGFYISQNFKERYGYQIEEELPKLFLGHGEKARAVRRDFYQLTSDLFEQSYFKQISDYCASVGLRFSGHLLGEDWFSTHVKFEGNYFKLLRHMQIPGLDALDAVPRVTWERAIVPHLVRSVAELYGREHVMDETSGYCQGGKVGTREVAISLLLQYAFGADVFNSYYRLDSEGDGDGLDMKEALKILHRPMAYLKNISYGSVILHYPIETMMSLYKPGHDVKEEGDDCGVLSQACESSMYIAMFALLDNQVTFLFSDTDSLELAAKRRPSVLILPEGYVEEKMIAVLDELKKQGCRVLYFCRKEGLLEEYDKIRKYASLVRSTEELTGYLVSCGLVNTSGDTKGVAALRAENGILLVNSTDEAKKVWVKERFTKVYDLFEDREKENRFDVQTGTEIALDALGAVLLER